MSWKKIAATAAFSIVVVAAVWTYLVTTYETQLGTSNVILVNTDGSASDSHDDNSLVGLSFDDGAEDLLWSSVEINLMIEGETYGCSFGSQSNSDSQNGKVSPNLGADGLTFTTVVDATDSDSYTYFDLPNQLESNSTNYWMKLSSTDIYLSEGVSWTFIEGVSISDVSDVPSDMNNDTSERLEWYSYDMSVHRVNPNEGVYVLSKDDFSLKINFLTYYNNEDESRHPTMQIAAVGESDFPALDNPGLVVPSPCKIVSFDEDKNYWNSNETIMLQENQINLCDGTCSIKLTAYYETVEIEVDGAEFQIG